jgi:hypothetical protein
MRVGFLVDLISKPIGAVVADQMEWAEGEPERTFWGQFVNLEDKKRRKVLTYACTRCGFLESYAALDPTQPGT